MKLCYFCHGPDRFGYHGNHGGVLLGSPFNKEFADQL